ncbi:MAG TPA: hypothetical protein VIP54_11240, partial [Microterricola sp.]
MSNLPPVTPDDAGAQKDGTPAEAAGPAATDARPSFDELFAAPAPTQPELAESLRPRPSKKKRGRGGVGCLIV